MQTYLPLIIRCTVSDNCNWHWPYFRFLCTIHPIITSKVRLRLKLNNHPYLVICAHSLQMRNYSQKSHKPISYNINKLTRTIAKLRCSLGSCIWSATAAAATAPAAAGIAFLIIRYCHKKMRKNSLPGIQMHRTNTQEFTSASESTLIRPPLDKLEWVGLTILGEPTPRSTKTALWPSCFCKVVMPVDFKSVMTEWAVDGSRALTFLSCKYDNDVHNQANDVCNFLCKHAQKYLKKK